MTPQSLASRLWRIVLGPCRRPEPTRHGATLAALGEHVEQPIKVDFALFRRVRDMQT